MWRDNGKLSWRKLWNLVSQLPPESAVATILRIEAAKNPNPSPPKPHDVETEQWSRAEHVLAAIRDELHYLRHAYGQAHKGKSKMKWQPEPLPRPGIKPSKKKQREVLTTPQAETLWEHLQKTQNMN